MKTYHPKEGDITRRWHLVDLKGKVLGRAATRMATVLTGKHKPQYSPAVDTGDFIVALNSDHIVLTGRKATDKIYHWHTGAIGGIKSAAARDMIARDSRRVVRRAVWGMLPKNKLSRHMLKKLKVYRDDKHEHAAQHPQTLSL